MTLIHIDGFDHYATADAAAKGWLVSGTYSVSTAIARTGTSCFRSTAFTPSYALRGVPILDEHATFIAGFGLNVDSLSERFFSFNSDSGSTRHVIFHMTAAGAIAAYRGTTLLGTSNPVLSINTWAFVEFKVLLSATVGTVDVRVNGASVLALTGQNTKNNGTKTVFDAIMLGREGNNGPTISQDDLYLCNGAGSVNNTFLGDVRVRTLLPNANGATSGLAGSDGNSTDNYLLVDEAAPATADYVGSATDNLKDTYGFPDLVETAGVVHGVQISSYAAKTDAGAKSLALVTRSGATDYDSSDLALGTSAAYLRSLRELDPATAAAWTIAGINSAEFGVKVRP